MSKKMRLPTFWGDFEIQTDHLNLGKTTRPSDSQQK